LFEQMTRTRPFRRMILHFSHIGFTDGLTFMCPFGVVGATRLWLPVRPPLHTRSKLLAHPASTRTERDDPA
jgi:hypothetical protein